VLDCFSSPGRPRTTTTTSTIRKNPALSLSSSSSSSCSIVFLAGQTEDDDDHEHDQEKSAASLSCSSSSSCSIASPAGRTEDDDDHEHDQVISSPSTIEENDYYLPTRITCPSGLEEPPAFSTLIANAAADSTGVTVSKLVRISPSLGTAKTPALTGWVIFGSITHN
jgi:hypothetical protein